MRDALEDYLNRIEEAVFNCPNARVERYAENAISDERVNLHVRLRMDQGHLLEIREAILLEDDGSLNILAHSYHFQDINNVVIFRYDNTPHYPNLETFPDHKHLLDAVLASSRPTIQQVIREAMTAMSQELPGHPN